MYRYQFCGPGTKLAQRLERGEKGVNKLDNACREHDIAYSKHKTLTDRHKADQALEYKAWERVKALDSTLGEKISSWLVTNAMKMKRKMGMGLKNNEKKTSTSRKSRKNKKSKKVNFKKGLLLPLKKETKNKDVSTKTGMTSLVKQARAIVKEIGGKRNINIPRVLPVPKRGGILPLIPILAGLSAIGSLTGGISAVARAVNDAKAARKKLEETERHNETMEAIALGKKGNGLYLHKYRKGLGLYLSSSKQSKNFQ